MAKGWNICFIFNIWSYFHLSIKYWKVKSLFWGCFCVKFPKSYLKGIVMLNSIMMSNAPLRPIFIFAISKQILPACLPHDILYRLTKKGKISRCFRTRTSVIIDDSNLSSKFYLNNCLLYKLLCCWIKASFVCSHYLQVFWEV